MATMALGIVVGELILGETKNKRERSRKAPFSYLYMYHFSPLFTRENVPLSDFSPEKSFELPVTV